MEKNRNDLRWSVGFWQWMCSSIRDASKLAKTPRLGGTSVTDSSSFPRGQLPINCRGFFLSDPVRLVLGYFTQVWAERSMRAVWSIREPPNGKPCHCPELTCSTVCPQGLPSLIPLAQQRGVPSKGRWGNSPPENPTGLFVFIHMPDGSHFPCKSSLPRITHLAPC